MKSAFMLISRHENVLEWFNLDSLKANPDEFQFMVFGGEENIFSFRRTKI